MSTYSPAEYVRLLRVASEALGAARMYGEKHSQWRPAYADLILLDSMDGWGPEDDGTLTLACPPDEAMVKVVEAQEAVELPVQVWEWYDEDADQVLSKIPGVLMAEGAGDE